MTEIHCMTQGHKYWRDTIDLAARCSWKAGPFLAQQMRANAFAPWERVFAACVDGKVAGFCTLAERDELPDSVALTPFIGFVFVDEPYRGHRLSEQMIECAIAHARDLGYARVYLMSGEIGLYEKYGFQKLGDYRTIYDTVDQLFVRSVQPSDRPGDCAQGRDAP